MARRTPIRRTTPLAGTLIAAVGILGTPAAAESYAVGRMTGTLVDQGGGNVGSVAVVATASGVTLVTVAASPMPTGTHGVHLHENGVCEGDFSSAGGHIAGGREHGLVVGGPHPGDLPNGFVPEGADALNYEAFATEYLSMEEHLMDADGAALIVHSGPDDYESQPSGDAGGRIACAVLTVAPVENPEPIGE